MNDEKKRQELGAWYDKNFKVYENCAGEMSSIIEKILKRKKIPFHSITYRVKDKESYLQKGIKDKYRNPVEEIMDLAGIRVITYTNRDVKEICEIVKQEFCIDEENSEDKSQKMGEDQVGYLSVHYIAALKEDRTSLSEYCDFKGVRSEIQIRTLLQHAWAEIEHDRNYKFSGVLPPEIKRRFYLAAGVLEMIDREFDSLSEEIDKYSREMQDKINRGDYEVGIDSTSLKKYVLSKFQSKYIVPCDNGVIVRDGIIRELKRFGFESIQDIEDKLTDEMMDKLEVNSKSNTYIGLLRDFMMILDIGKYFDKAYEDSWGEIDSETVSQLKKLGIPFEKFMEIYDIRVIDDDLE